MEPKKYKSRQEAHDDLPNFLPTLSDNALIVIMSVMLHCEPTDMVGFEMVLDEMDKRGCAYLNRYFDEVNSK